jgi:hypothetical protein
LRPVETSGKPVMLWTSLDQSGNCKRPEKTGLNRSGSIFWPSGNFEDRSWSQSYPFKAKDRDQTGLLITNEESTWSPFFLLFLGCLPALVHVDSLRTPHGVCKNKNIKDSVHSDQIKFIPMVHSNQFWFTQTKSHTYIQFIYNSIHYDGLLSNSSFHVCSHQFIHIYISPSSFTT